ncbi:putative holin [Burkholderia pseudomallei]|uniref:putative holin n=1 Tax=Burkholderia pseudomallei TaxID=28450 RepID=UPI000A1C866F|nr:putative holin [Burkholderia pseudomallei]
MKISRLKAPRLTVWLIASIVLALLAYTTRQSDPLLSITFYKAHLMSLGGWGGYWLDRLIFPYARPHEFVEGDVDAHCVASFQAASIRRAIIVAASLICVGLAA